MAAVYLSVYLHSAGVVDSTSAPASRRVIKVACKARSWPLAEPHNLQLHHDRGAAADQIKAKSLQASRFTMPTLQCSQPVRVNPSMWRVWEQADEWTVSTMISPGTREKDDDLLRWRVPLLGCTTGVDMDEAKCLLNTQFLMWLFLFDDIADDTGSTGLGLNERAVRDLHRALLRCMMDESAEEQLPRVPATVAERHRRAAELVGWWRELRCHMSPSHEARFLDRLSCGLAASESQVLARAAGQLPDLQTYIERRRQTSGLFGHFVALEVFLGVDPEDPILGCDLLQEVRKAVNDHVSWVNDLFSFSSEYARGDYNNLVAVLWKSDPSCGGDLAKSVEETRRMIQERDEDFSRLLREARNCKAIMRARAMDDFLQSMADWMAGNLYWSYATSRYFGKPYPANIPFEVHVPTPQLHI